MSTRKLAQSISLACLIAFAPVSAALAAGPAAQDHPTAEDSGSGAGMSRGKLATNGKSLNGLRVNGRKAGGSARSAQCAHGGAGMTVVSIELPHGSHHAK